MSQRHLHPGEYVESKYIRRERILAVICLLLLALFMACTWGVADAETNLAVICRKGAIANSPRAACTGVEYGAPGPADLIRVFPENTWQPFASVAADKTTEVCRNNVPLNSVSGPNGEPCTDWNPAFRVGDLVPVIPVCLDGQCQLTWTLPTANTDGTALTNLSGYRMYSGCDTCPLGLYKQIAVPSTLFLDITGFAPGTYAFALTAYNTTANESSKTVPLILKVIAGNKTPQTPTMILRFIPR